MSELHLGPIELGDRHVDDAALVAYRDQLHPGDIDTLEALLDVADLADSHAIIRWRDDDGNWRLVEHRVVELANTGTVALTRVDVTDREREIDRVGRIEAYWRAVLRHGRAAIAVVDPATLRITHASDPLARLVGRSADDLIGSRVAWHVDRRDLPRLARLRTEPFAHGRLVAEMRLRARDADPIWVELTVNDARHDPAVGALVVNVHGIADRKLAEARLRSSEHKFRVLAQHVADGAFILDEDRRITFATDKGAANLGREGCELEGRVLSIDRHGDDFEFVIGSDAAASPLSIPPTEVRGPGNRWYQVTAHDLREDPVVAGHVLVLRDVTADKNHVERLQQAAERDPLTGLLNRRGIEAKLEEFLRAGVSVGIGFLDLDGFKTINDTFGHATGDDLLRQVAARLGSCLRPEDDVGRFGGDEFVIVIPKPPTELAFIRLTNRIVDSIGGSYRAQGHAVCIGVSAGWSIAMPGIPPADALRRADQRMYEQKRRAAIV